ncbi:hypothetical protein HA520_10445 [Azotobacter chroococcum]|uniref:Phage protein n=1 Tax=Azotobacter chroococcum TaxID=353 RepID=A0AA43Z694_9GAMM|nr:hypothetical protein [Azotobacter chroococcum]NHN77698.1 hypothetical protein [Azotobacter chroococcum]
MDETEPLSLDQLYAAICTGIAAVLPAAQAVEVWPDIRRRIALPAVLLELDELEPGTDPGTGETALVGRFQARIVVDPVVAQPQQRASLMAAVLAAALRDQRWGLPIGAAEFVEAGPDWFKPELDGYIVWRVEWRHELHLGQLEWPYEDSTGTTLYLGIDPDTGPGHESDYWPAGEEAP